MSRNRKKAEGFHKRIKNKLPNPLSIFRRRRGFGIGFRWHSKADK